MPPGVRLFPPRPRLATCRTSTCSPRAVRESPRCFATTPAAQAGHNKWSKTKHIKAATDKKKSSERTAFTRIITLYSKLYGSNVGSNPQLASAVAAATKASVPKTVIENAIARGQGFSATGAQLEPMTMEILMPPNIAIIADIETDNKSRTLQDVRLTARKLGGVIGSTAFYFSKRGRALFRAKEGAAAPTLSDMLEEAIEHEGAEDVEELPDGGFLAWTQPAMLTAITEALATRFELEIHESDIIWVPSEETRVQIDSSEQAEALYTMFSALKEYPDVKAVYANVSKGTITDEEWDKIDRKIDV